MSKRILVVLFAMLLAVSVNAKIELISQRDEQVLIEEVSQNDARDLCEEVLQARGFPVVLTDYYIYVYLNDLEDPHGYETVDEIVGEDCVIENLFPIRISDLKPAARTAFVDRDLKKFFQLMGIVYTVCDDKVVTSKINYKKFEQQCNLVSDSFVDTLSVEYRPLEYL